jgi:hypothetical protein
LPYSFLQLFLPAYISLRLSVHMVEEAASNKS